VLTWHISLWLNCGFASVCDSSCWGILQIVAWLWLLASLLARSSWTRRPQWIVIDVQVDAILWPMLATVFRLATVKKATITKCHVNTNTANVKYHEKARHQKMKAEQLPRFWVNSKICYWQQHYGRISFSEDLLVFQRVCLITTSSAITKYVSKAYLKRRRGLEGPDFSVGRP